MWADQNPKMKAYYDKKMRDFHKSYIPKPTKQQTLKFDHNTHKCPQDGCKDCGSIEYDNWKDNEVLGVRNNYH